MKPQEFEIVVQLRSDRGLAKAQKVGQVSPRELVFPLCVCVCFVHVLAFKFQNIVVCLLHCQLYRDLCS